MADNFSFNPLKSLSVVGKLDQTEFFENVCIRNCELSFGNWALTLADITISHADNFKLSTDLIFDVTCNLVQEHSFTITKTVRVQSASLAKYCVEKKPKLKVNLLPNRWFTINNPCENILIQLKQWPSEKPLTENDKKFLKETTICFTILLKRIN